MEATRLSKEEIVAMILKLKSIYPQDVKSKAEIQRLQQLLDK